MVKRKTQKGGYCCRYERRNCKGPVGVNSGGRANRQIVYIPGIIIPEGGETKSNVDVSIKLSYERHVYKHMQDLGLVCYDDEGLQNLIRQLFDGSLGTMYLGKLHQGKVEMFQNLPKDDWMSFDKNFIVWEGSQSGQWLTGYVFPTGDTTTIMSGPTKADASANVNPSPCSGFNGTVRGKLNPLDCYYGYKVVFKIRPRNKQNKPDMYKNLIIIKQIIIIEDKDRAGEGGRNSRNPTNIETMKGKIYDETAHHDDRNTIRNRYFNEDNDHAAPNDPSTKPHVKYNGSWPKASKEVAHHNRIKNKSATKIQSLSRGHLQRTGKQAEIEKIEKIEKMLSIPRVDKLARNQLRLPDEDVDKYLEDERWRLDGERKEGGSRGRRKTNFFKKVYKKRRKTKRKTKRRRKTKRKKKLNKKSRRRTRKRK